MATEQLEYDDKALDDAPVARGLVDGRQGLIDVLNFIYGYTNMPVEQWQGRFPVWVKMLSKARLRFQEETDFGRRSWARTNVSVTSEDLAIHYWVFLPLIHATLTANLAGSAHER